MNCLKYGNKIYKPEILFNKIRQNPVFFAKKHGITGALLEEILGINTDKNKILNGVQMSMLSPSDFDSNGNVLPEVLAEIQAEREQIIAQAKANGTYMKAPNGKPTNLNEEQWALVRTQRFKDWFGDWELGAKFKTTRTAESVSEAQSKIKDIVNKPLTNKKLGITATLSNKTLQKLGSEKATKQSVSSDLHALAIANIDTIFENALIDVTHIDTKNRTGINQIHRIGSAIQNPKNGEYAPVMITLKEYTDPNNGNRIYSVEALDIETKKSAGQLESSSQSNDQSPIADFITKIEKEIEKANNSSKVVDENGEPLVVYHGTNVEFTEFNRKYIGKSNGVALGKGFYFTDDKNYAKNYSNGKEPIGTFLNIRSNISHTERVWNDNILSEIIDKVETEAKRTGYNLFWYYEGKRRSTAIKEIIKELKNAQSDSDFLYMLSNRVGSDMSLINKVVNEVVGNEIGHKELDRKIYVASDPNQIKSATDNVGTYSEDSNDIRYQIIGEQGARNLDNIEESTKRIENLAVAREMETARKSPKEIRLATGWERGVDSKWRYEIPDGNFNPNIKINDVINKELPLVNLYDNKELYSAYPELENLTVKITELNKYNSGSYRKNSMMGIMLDEYILLNSNLFKDNPNDNTLSFTDIAKSTLIHEIQHAIQEKENFAKGGSVDVKKYIYDNYQKELRDFNLKNKTFNIKSNKEEAAKTLRNFAKYKAVQELRRYANSENITRVASHILKYRDLLNRMYVQQDYVNISNEVPQMIESLLKEPYGFPNPKSEKELYKIALKHYALNKADLIERLIPVRYISEFKENPHHISVIERALERVFEKARQEYETLVEKQGKIGYVYNKYKDVDTYEVYKALSGEVEARNVQQRMYMSPEERRQKLLSETEDVAREDQIFLVSNGEMNAMSINENDIDKIQNILDNATAEPMPKPIETLAEFRKEFDKPVKTPINEIRVKDNVFQKITNTNRKEISGTIRPTLENPTFIVEDTDGSKLFVKVFNKGGEKNYNVVAVNKQGEVENYLSSVHIKSNNNLKNKIKNGAKLIRPQKRLSDENGSQISLAPNSTNVQNNFKNPPIKSDDNSDIEFHIGNGNANTNTTKPKFTPPHQGLAPKALVLSIIDKIKENNGNKAEGFKLLTESEWYKKLPPQEQGNFEENTIIDYLFDWNEKTIENAKARNEWKREQQAKRDDEYRQQNVFNKSARERRLERMKQREEADKKLRNKKPWISKENVKRFITKVSDRQFNVKRIAHKLGMINTYNRIITNAGSSAKAKRDFEQARDKIFKGLTFEEKSHLDMLIHYRRIITIDENRESRGLGQIRHQGGQTKDSAREEVDDLRLAIGDEKFNMLNERATLYFDEFKKVLDAQLSAGMLSQEQYDSMINIDYQPRIFIEHLLDAEGRLMENSKEYQENNKLGKEIIKKLAEGSFGDQVMNAEWLLNFAVGARNSQLFMNELNQTFALRDYPEAKAEYDAIQNKPKDEWTKEERNIVKYFEQLESKVRFPKNKSEDTPRGYRKAYYYENGEAKHFFMEEGFYDEWYDVQQGFIGNPDTKRLISKISGSSLVKMFATGRNPAFIIGNTPRDFAQIVMFSPEYSNNSVLATMQLAKDAIKGIRALIQDDLGNQDTLLAKYIEYGGGMDFLHTQGLGDMRNGIAKAMEKIFSPKFRDNFLFGLDTISLLKLSRYSETMFRLGVFQRSLNNQLKEYNKLNGTNYKSVEELPNESTKKDMYIGATASARSVLDFNQGGTITKDMEAFVPYINAGVQGTRVAVDAFTKRPKQTTIRVLQAGAFFGGIGFGMSMLLMSLFGDDEDDKTAIEKVLEAYDGISQHQRTNYFNIVVPGKMENGEYRVIKIAKTQAITPVAYFMEEMLLNMFRKDKDKRGAGEIISGVLQAFNKNMSPIDLPKGVKLSDLANAATGTASRMPVLKGAMSVTTGWDFFRNQPLDPTTAGKNLPLELEGMKNDKVEAFYKAFGEISSDSSVKMKAMVESLITSPDTNPFITFVYGTLEGVARSKSFGTNFTEYFFDEKQGALVRRMFSETNEYNRMARDKERTKAKVDELIVKSEKDREKLNDLADSYKSGEISKDEIKDAIKKMTDNNDLRNKYLNRIKNKVQRQDVDSRVWDIKYSTANSDEAKAYLIYEYFGDFSGEEDASTIKKHLKENGLATESILKEYEKVKALKK